MIKIEVDTNGDNLAHLTVETTGDIVLILAELTTGISELYEQAFTMSPMHAELFKAGMIAACTDPDSPMWTIGQKDSAADAGTSTTEQT